MHKQNNIQIVLLSFIGYLLIIITTIKPIGIDNDSLAYVQNIVNFSLNSNAINYLEKEVTFWFALFITESIFNNNHMFLFFFYSFLQISIIIYAIKKLSVNYFFSIIIYLLVFYILFGLTQIRVGVGLGIFILSIKDIYNKKIINYTIKIFIAFLFHYSLIFLIVFYFVNPKKISKLKYIYILLVSVFIFIFVSQYSEILERFILNNTPVFFYRRIEEIILNARTSSEMNINIFNIGIMLKLLIYYTFLVNLHLIENIYKYILFKIYSFSVIIYMILSFIPILATRLSEFSLIVIILLFPLITTIKGNKKTVLFLYFLTLLFSINVFRYQIMNLLNFKDIL